MKYGERTIRRIIKDMWEIGVHVMYFHSYKETTSIFYGNPNDHDIDFCRPLFTKSGRQRLRNDNFITRGVSPSPVGGLFSQHIIFL